MSPFLYSILVLFIFFNERLYFISQDNPHYYAVGRRTANFPQKGDAPLL